MSRETPAIRPLVTAPLDTTREIEFSTSTYRSVFQIILMWPWFVGSVAMYGRTHSRTTHGADDHSPQQTVTGAVVAAAVVPAAVVAVAVPTAVTAGVVVAVVAAMIAPSAVESVTTGGRDDPDGRDPPAGARETHRSSAPADD